MYAKRHRTEAELLACDLNKDGIKSSNDNRFLYNLFNAAKLIVSATEQAQIFSVDDRKEKVLISSVSHDLTSSNNYITVRKDVSSGDEFSYGAGANFSQIDQRIYTCGYIGPQVFWIF
jgi:hypothetical protein